MSEKRPLSIHVTALGKRFGEVRALRDLALAIEGPAIFGFVGPDGAGKTTLLRVLTGLLAHEEGSVSVLGIDPRREASTLKPLLGYVPQTFSMYPTLTVSENLEFVARCHGLSSGDYAERAVRLLEVAGLAGVTGSRVETLSGGMKQKLALCGALLPRPRLLVLDEPTNGVDVHARAGLWEVVRSVSPGSLVVVATNCVDEANRCDRICYLAGGRSIATGSPLELRRSAPVAVYSVRVPGITGNELARRLRELRQCMPRLDVTPASASARVEVQSGSEDAFVRGLGHVGLDAARIDRVEPDLATALLALSRKACELPSIAARRERVAREPERMAS